MGSGKKVKSEAVIEQDSVFATVPSRTEVEKAISELQSFLDGNADGLPQDYSRLVQMLKNDKQILQSSGYQRVQEAFHLLRTDFKVREVVSSISTDKAVWHAVLSNKAVQDLRGSLHQVQISDEELDLAATILRWILRMTQSIFNDMMVKLGFLIGETFQKATVGNPIGGTLEYLLLLSVVILIIVLVTRGHQVTSEK